MTGPEHYRAAESLLDALRTGNAYDHERAGLAARAQTHAILALVAATALGTANPDNDPDAEWWDSTHDWERDTEVPGAF